MDALVTELDKVLSDAYFKQPEHHTIAALESLLSQNLESIKEFAELDSA
jgi:hypothetical protein